MEIEVKDPNTGALLQLEAKPAQLKGIHGFQIRHPNGSGFFIANRSGTWRAADDHHIDADFLINIGLALEGHSVREQTGLNTKGSHTKAEELPYIDNQPDIDNGIGDEGFLDPNKP